MYDALGQGRVEPQRIRRTLASGPLPRFIDGRIVLAVDVSPWLRSDAPTSADRLLCVVYGRGRGQAQLSDQDNSRPPASGWFGARHLRRPVSPGDAAPPAARPAAHARATEVPLPKMKRSRCGGTSVGDARTRVSMFGSFRGRRLHDKGFHYT